VSFRLNPGESLGIIGPNGAGKSTLLRVLARITPPTEGTVFMRGRLTPLLGVGTGFVGSLSGRANVYLNASILGMSRPEVNARFDEIVDFAGVRDFIDMPVKLYSSGMYARLAFSVAAHVITDILLVDEILSVGDAAFRGKSLQKMTNLMTSGGTVVFVSHSIDSVMQFCQKALWIDHGRVVMYGSADEVAKAYLSSVSELKHIWKPTYRETTENDRPGPRRLQVKGAEPVGFELVDRGGKSKAIFRRTDDVYVRLRYVILDATLPIVPVIHVHCVPRHGVDADVHVCTAWDTDAMTPRPVGEYLSTVRIPGAFLNDGEYSLSVALVSPGGKLLRHFREWRILTFKVVDVAEPKTALGHITRGVVRPNFEWHSAPVESDGEIARENRATIS
jgi:lipopolysaccharide transport system ATP-binding protein